MDKKEREDLEALKKAKEQQKKTKEPINK